MKVGIVGGGDVGSYCGRVLADRGHEVTLLERDQARAQQLDEELNASVICANGSSATVLHQLRVEEMSFFFALTQSDQDNILACSIAKKMGANATIARIHDNTYSDYSQLNYQMHFGIDLLVNPEALAANEIAKHLRNPGRVLVENFGRGEIEVQQMRVSSQSVYVGKTLQEIRLPDGVRVVYISHNGRHIIPDRSTVIEPFAIVTLVGHPQKIFDLRNKFKPEFSAGLTNVAILGLNEAAVSLLKSLASPRFRIKAFDANRQICEKLAERFPRISAICAKGTSLRVMEEENIADCDHFIACSKSDEENILACLQARRLGARHIHLLLNKGDYEDVVQGLRNDLALETIASPRLATVDELLRFICPDPILELASLGDDLANFYEVRIDSRSRSHNREICEISLPPGCVIVALLHRFQVKVPAAHDRILAGDRLILVAERIQRQAFRNALL